MEKYVNLELEIIEIRDDIITTSGNPNETPILPYPTTSGQGNNALKAYEIYEAKDLEE